MYSLYFFWFLYYSLSVWVCSQSDPTQAKGKTQFLSFLDIYHHAEYKLIYWFLQKHLLWRKSGSLTGRKEYNKKTHFKSISLWYEIISSFILNYFQHFQTHQNVSGSLRQFWTKLDINWDTWPHSWKVGIYFSFVFIVLIFHYRIFQQYLTHQEFDKLAFQDSYMK